MRERRAVLVEALIGAGLLVVIAVGCGGGDGDSGGGSDRSSSTAQPDRRAEGDAGSTDPFSTVLARTVRGHQSATDGPFPTFDDSGGSGSYTGEAYTIVAKPTDATTVAGYGRDDFGNETVIEAWLDTPNAPDDAAFGVVCRLQEDGENYYRFGVGNDGTYSIAKVVDDEATILTGDGEWVTSDLLDPTDRSFIIGAECAGNRLSLYSGYDLVDSVTDPTFDTGAVGIFVQTFDEGGASADVSVFTATGYDDDADVSTTDRDDWEAFFRSTPELGGCELGDPAAADTEPVADWVSRCDDIVYFQAGTEEQAAALFEDLLGSSGRELAPTNDFPDCAAETDVRNDTVACLDAGDGDVVAAWRRGPIVGTLRTEQDALTGVWAPDWWPVTAARKPG